MSLFQQMRLIFPLFLLTFNCSSFLVSGFEDQNENCGTWASEGECLNNPTYMLTQCHKSCRFLKDIDPDCNIYAQEGRCTADTDQLAILTQCAESCGYSYQWNQFARNRMGIANLPTHEQPMLERFRSDSAYEFAQKYGRAEIFKQAAIDLYQASLAHLLGENALPVLNTYSSPSEFHLIMGLGQSLLAATRSGIKVLKTITSEFSVEDEVTEALATLQVTDADLDLLLSNMETDRLMRLLFPIALRLEPIMSLIHDLSLHEEPSEQNSIIPADGRQLITTLANGKQMPLLGFGTWQMNGEECAEAVKVALQQGYRHIDTADAYNNEVEVGKGIKLSGVPREEIFLATKLSRPGDLGYDETMAMVQLQLRRLDTPYIDLYMLHSTFGSDEQTKARVDGTWRALQELYQQGVVRALGVSNFEVNEVEELKARNPGSFPPMVLQNKFDIYHHGQQTNIQGTDYVNYCRENDVVLVGYSGLSSYPYVMTPSEDAHVRNLAAKIGRTPRQVLLRWQIQLGVAAIPKSQHPDRISENLDVFDFALSADDMEMLGSLSWLVASELHRPTWSNFLEIDRFHHSHAEEL